MCRESLFFCGGRPHAVLLHYEDSVENAKACILRLLLAGTPSAGRQAAGEGERRSCAWKVCTGIQNKCEPVPCHPLMPQHCPSLIHSSVLHPMFSS